MNRLLSFAESKIGCGYAWGTQGETLTPSLLTTLINRFGQSHYYFGGVNAEKWIGKEVYDCSGLIVAGLRKLGLIAPNADYSCDGLYKMCRPVKKEELKEGDLAFIGTPQDWTHVGIYAGNGKTVEAMSTSKGVVYGDIKRFTAFGRLPFDLDEPLTWQEILLKVTARPEDWQEAIDVAVNAAQANGDLGPLEIFKFLPDLILKIYNR